MTRCGDSRLGYQSIEDITVTLDDFPWTGEVEPCITRRIMQSWITRRIHLQRSYLGIARAKQAPSGSEYSFPA